MIGLELLQVVYNNASAFDKYLADNMLMLKIIVVLSPYMYVVRGLA